jgi:hypothetical protein
VATGEGAEESRPRAGIDYPGAWHELLQWFPDEEACRAYLEQLRWPQGFVCPVCGSTWAWRIGGRRWMCGACARQTSVTAGTIFDKTRTPLTSWFAAA